MSVTTQTQGIGVKVEIFRLARIRAGPHNRWKIGVRICLGLTIVLLCIQAPHKVSVPCQIFLFSR